MGRIGLLPMTLAFAFASASFAAQRTFVASTGLDANPSAVNLNGSIGISATGGGVIEINGNTIARNADFDLVQSGTGVIRTFGNNALTGGGAGISGTLTGVSLK